MTRCKYFVGLLFLVSFLFLGKSLGSRWHQPLQTGLKLTKLHDQKKIIPIKSPNKDSRSHLFSKSPAPLNTISEEEAVEFPGARVVEAIEMDSLHSGEKIRMRILETHFKDSYIRTEEQIDAASGALLHRSEMVATHFLVRLPESEKSEDFLNQLGPDVISLERVTTKDSLYQVQLTSHALAALPRVFEEIESKHLSVLSKEPDFLVHASIAPNNPLYSQQWYLWKTCSNIDGPFDQRLFFSGIDACDAWNLQTSAASIVVAVIDSGIRYTHEDLAANMWHESTPSDGTICGWNFAASSEELASNNPMDGLGHGTACAGIIGAVGNSGVGIVGVAWNVKLMALKFLNSAGVGSISNAISSIDFAIEHGAQILNCSWGYVTPKDDLLFGGKFSNHEISPENQTALEAALNRARNANVIVVAAAGNEGKNNDTYPEYPANYALDNIISVASTTEDNELSYFSNYGAKTVHIAAPGEEIFSTWARNDADYLTAQTREEILGKLDDESDDKRPAGTSFSAPQVAGALALLKQRFPTWTYQQLLAHIIQTSDKIPSLAGKMVGGKLNVARALEAGN